MPTKRAGRGASSDLLLADGTKSVNGPCQTPVLQHIVSWPLFQSTLPELELAYALNPRRTPKKLQPPNWSAREGGKAPTSASELHRATDRGPRSVPGYDLDTSFRIRNKKTGFGCKMARIT